MTDNRCLGSFQQSHYYPDGDGKITCHMCGRTVGMRNPRTRQLALHTVPAQAAPWSVIGEQQNAAEMVEDTCL